MNRHSIRSRSILSSIFRGLFTITNRATLVASQFYTWRNLPEIVRVKIKSLLLIPIVIDHDRRAADRRWDSGGGW